MCSNHDMTVFVSLRIVRCGRDRPILYSLARPLAIHGFVFTPVVSVIPLIRHNDCRPLHLDVEECGQTCRDVTSTLSNNQDETATGVTVYTRVFAGEDNTAQEDLELEMAHFEQALEEIEEDSGGDARSGVAAEAVRKTVRIKPSTGDRVAVVLNR